MTLTLAFVCALPLGLPAAQPALQQPAPQAPPPAGAAATASEPTPPPRPSPFEGGLESLPPRGLRASEPGATAGYTLINPLNSKRVHLVDRTGAVVHSWQTDYVPGGACRLLDNGHLLRLCQEPNNPRFHGGGIGGRVQELDWDGKVVWEYVLATDQLTIHHDIEVLPNGHLLLIAWEYHSPDEALAAGRALSATAPEGLWPDTVLELERTSDGGRIVWQWRAWDHLMQDQSPKKPNYAAKVDLPGRIDVNADHRYRPKESDEEKRKREEDARKMAALGYAGGATPPPAPDGAGKPPPKDQDKEADWLHVNAVDYHPGLDVVVLSTPHMGELWVVDHSTTTAQAATSSGGRHGRGGDLLWRWGNPRNYGRGAEQDQQLFYQHNPTWLADAPSDAPRLLVFNNGMRRAGDYSEVLELELPSADLGALALSARGHGPAEPSWEYSDAPLFFSPFISGAQRLPNGHTQVCSGAGGRVFEVTPDRKVVWDYRNPLGGDEKPTEQGGKAPPLALFRAEWYAPDAPALARLAR